MRARDGGLRLGEINRSQSYDKGMASPIMRATFSNCGDVLAY